MSKPSPAAERRIAAVKKLHAEVLGADPSDMNGELHLEVPEILERMRALAPLSRAPRWAQAVEAWAAMLEAEVELWRVVYRHSPAHVWASRCVGTRSAAERFIADVASLPHGEARLEAATLSGHEYWAYVQGSVYFGYATLGL